MNLPIELVRIARELLGESRVAAMDLEDASFEELEKIANFLGTSLSDHDSAYAAYALNSLMHSEWAGIVGGLYKKAVVQYRKAFLSWFEEALLDRANVVNFGGLNGVLTDFVRGLPEQALTGKQSDLPEFRKDWAFLSRDRLMAVGRKVVSVMVDDAKKDGVWKVEGGGCGQHLQKSDDGRWFIPYNDWTARNQSLLRGMGFKPEWQTKAWYVQNVTPQIEELFSDRPPKVTVPTPEAMKDWYFKSWMPKNVKRFDNVFDTYVRDAGSTIRFFFDVDNDGKVSVSMTRGVTRLSDAIEELRLRYIGRQGREPWLEVMSRTIELKTSSENPTQVMEIIDRMNNLEHSNGMFMERFPNSVKSWYLKFLNAKYHSPTAYELASYIDDSDLAEFLKFLSGERRTFIQDQEQPDYQNMEKEKPVVDGPNWIDQGYPYAKGKSRPEKDDPAVQEDLDKLRSFGASRRCR